jgi:UDP:flavonoid glycosyltransferase YjiC (YdhE family)
MARFLFASIPVPAHAGNALPFAARLVERGHEVVWYAGRAFHDRISGLGAIPISYRTATDWEGDPFDAFPQLARYKGPPAIGHGFADVFVGEAAARVADLRPVLAQQRIDAMLHDGLMIGVGMLSELTGVPHATFGVVRLPPAPPAAHRALGRCSVPRTRPGTGSRRAGGRRWSSPAVPSCTSPRARSGRT